MYDLTEWSLADGFEQPPANEEETRQSEQKENTIIPQQGVSQTEMADMRIHHENHRKPSHRINVFYSLSCHDECKDTNK